MPYLANAWKYILAYKAMEAKRQYLFTCKVSRYFLLAVRGDIHSHTKYKLCNVKVDVEKKHERARNLNGCHELEWSG